jgi:chemotaxis protein methyltransferase CheR
VRTLLRPDGALFLGGTETTLMIDDAFERVSTAKGSYYCLKPSR